MKGSERYVGVYVFVEYGFSLFVVIYRESRCVCVLLLLLGFLVKELLVLSLFSVKVICFVLC